MSTSPRIKGVMAAGLTAFNNDLSVDTDLTLDHTRWLLDSGCDGVLLFGTTGEANSLSVDERLAFLDKLGASDLPKDKLMIGTGCRRSITRTRATRVCSPTSPAPSKPSAAMR